MSNRSDWMPGTRIGQMELCRVWLPIISQKKTAWNIPDSVPTNLGSLFAAAQEAYTAAQKFDERTSVVNQQVRTTFGAMVSAMRDIKKRYFYVPPLEESDLTRLGLRVPDTVPSTIGPPEAAVTVVINPSEKATVNFTIVPASGHSFDTRSEWGFRVHYGVLPHGGATQEDHLARQHLLRVPQRPEELPKSFFTRRKKDKIHFEYDESGMKCYICVRYENSKGEYGPWGPIVEAVIP